MSNSLLSKALKISLLYCALAICTLAITACGQKGPLKIPGPDSRSEANTDPVSGS